ncbi:MAG: DNA starvation/stationary phase protection protein [Flavobacteriaceae bacterium]|nr:DNA starvation/stationary phase protection protein [Flavobacteriaceae bacterium]
MKTTNRIGLKTEEAKVLAEKLNVLLADYSLFYQNTRGFHWNIKGDKFFELHGKFEELYNNLFIKIDDIAERILTLGYNPNHNFTDYLKVSEVKEATEVQNGIAAVENILNTFKSLLIKQREILVLSNDADDEGTNSLMSDYITEQEKLVWMYSAFLN